MSQRRLGPGSLRPKRSTEAVELFQHGLAKFGGGANLENQAAGVGPKVDRPVKQARIHAEGIERHVFHPGLLATEEAEDRVKLAQCIAEGLAGLRERGRLRSDRRVFRRSLGCAEDLLGLQRRQPF